MLHDTSNDRCEKRIVTHRNSTTKRTLPKITIHIMDNGEISPSGTNTIGGISLTLKHDFMAKMGTN